MDLGCQCYNYIFRALVSDSGGRIHVVSSHTLVQTLPLLNAVAPVQIHLYDSIVAELFARIHAIPLCVAGV